MKDKKSQLDKFKEAARQIETDDDEARFEERLKKLVQQKPSDRKVCPECGHVFQGNGWDGIECALGVQSMKT